MNGNRSVAGSVALVGVFVLLTGCTPTSVLPRVDRDVPYNEVSSISLDPPWAFVEDETLFLVLGGGSSCPTVPTGFEEGEQVAITVERGISIACTADIVWTTYEVPAQRIPDEITIVSGGSATEIPVTRVP